MDYRLSLFRRFFTTTPEAQLYNFAQKHDMVSGICRCSPYKWNVKKQVFIHIMWLSILMFVGQSHYLRNYPCILQFQSMHMDIIQRQIMC